MLRIFVFSAVLLLLSACSSSDYQPLLGEDNDAQFNTETDINSEIYDGNNKSSDLSPEQEGTDGVLPQLDIADNIYTHKDALFLKEQMGVALCDALHDVVAVLGEPTRIEKYESEAFGDDVYYYYYDHYWMIFAPGDENYFLMCFAVTDDYVIGPRDTIVGDRYDTVIEKFPGSEKEAIPIFEGAKNKSLYTYTSVDAAGRIDYDNEQVTSLNYSYATPENEFDDNNEEGYLGTFLIYEIEQEKVVEIRIGLLYTW